MVRNILIEALPGWMNSAKGNIYILNTKQYVITNQYHAQ